MKTINVFITLLVFSVSLFAQETNLYHNLKVNINPSNSSIEVVDELMVNSVLLNEELSFTLHDNFSVELLTKGLKLEIIKQSFPANDIGMDRDDAESESTLKLNEYLVTGFDKEKDITLKLKYSGKISSPIKQSEENYQRGFSESPGIISDLGIYLAGSTYWVPTFEDEMVSFNLTTELPEGWKNVTQGKRTDEKTENGIHTDTWDSPTPQEEVFLIAAKFSEYKYSMGSVDAMAFLRTPDEGIANKYLETTAQYMEMYRGLIGPFPYTKFALVENFWETGYGMPSFTLLGEKIIRFPFILHSSYPHELLHNWWGNSVYVDFEKGNWCEGITAYMADHLIKEQRGQGVEYRRSTLQKFTNYVNDENDFPISEFLSRHDGPSEAIGYGKTLMMFHMLRRSVGDEQFIKSFQVFNRNNKFKKASFDDIRIAFEEVTGEDLIWFFDQWIKRTGGPALSLENVSVENFTSVNIIKFNLIQTQKGEPFILDVPITFVTEEGSETKVFHMTEKEGKFHFTTKTKPYKILVDAQFDVFRKLDANETPPAFTKAYGSDKGLMILPLKTDKDFNLYEKFANSWIKGKEDKFEIENQSEIKTLPSDKTVWVLGTNNNVQTINESLTQYNSKILSDSVRLANKTLSMDNKTFFVSIKNPENPKQIVLSLIIDNEAAIPGLIRKLPHYGKYSYLAFEGDEPSNIAKGQWHVTNSPLIKSLNEKGKTIRPKLGKREALAKLAPVFSAKRMMEHVELLASDEMKGRGIDQPEIETAANYIADKFKEYGLQSGGDGKSYFQNFEHEFADKGKLKLKNVIGIIPGTNPDYSEAVVISAHYDHLGLGWPDVRKGNEYKIHNGADDNASGVAVMLELAKVLGKSLKPARTIIFVAFTAEEAGLIGSKYFVKNYGDSPTDKLLVNLNLDTVGRLFGKKIMILNGNTAREWKFIFMGTEYTTGVGTEIITQELDASDQVAFIEKGIPAVQFFSGPHSDYHRPTDTIDKIDSDGLVKVATVVKETLVYLSEREEPMAFTGKTKDKSKKAKVKSSKPNQGRSVSTGVMPDFSFSGEGVKIAAVSDDSPGANSGLLIGDIIKKFDGKVVKNLRDYSNLLKEHKPGDEVKLTIDRNGAAKEVKLVLAER